MMATTMSRKTIIISPTTTSVRMASLLQPRSLDGEKQNQPRKRQKLDHLSNEEKLMRRKLKNRVAAQSARDRKKARMDDLEIEVKELIDKTNSLTEEVKKLASHNAQLEKENTELRLRLQAEPAHIVNIKKEPKTDSPSPQPASECLPSGVSSSPSESFEHASPINDPLPKGQDPLVAALWTTHFVGWLMLSLMNSWMSSKKSQNNWEKQSPLEDHQKPAVEKMKTVQQIALAKWWGAHQRNWNPSKN